MGIILVLIFCLSDKKMSKCEAVSNVSAVAIQKDLISRGLVPYKLHTRS